MEESAMDERAHELAARFRAMNDGVLRFAERCADADWRRMVPHEGRSVAYLIDHIALGYAVERKAILAILTGQAPPLAPDEIPHTWTVEGLHAMNAARWEANPYPDREATIRRLRTEGEEMARFIAGLSGQDLERTMPTGIWRCRRRHSSSRLSSAMPRCTCPASSASWRARRGDGGGERGREQRGRSIAIRGPHPRRHRRRLHRRVRRRHRAVARRSRRRGLRAVARRARRARGGDLHAGADLPLPRGERPPRRRLPPPAADLHAPRRPRRGGRPLRDDGVGARAGRGGDALGRPLALAAPPRARCHLSPGAHGAGRAAWSPRKRPCCTSTTGARGSSIW